MAEQFQGHQQGSGQQRSENQAGAVKPAQPEPASSRPRDPNMKHLVRIVNTDIKGEKSVMMGLTEIKGVGRNFSNMICNLCQIDKHKKAGYLTQQEVERLDYAINHPQEVGAPGWTFNRKKDYETGEDKHLVKGELDFVKSNDIKRLQMIKSYRGSRHAGGLPVRGQKTRSNFRKNKGKVTGVKKKKSPAEEKASQEKAGKEKPGKEKGKEKK